MIGHTALREVVGANLLGTVSGTDLASSRLSLRILLLLAFQLIQAGAQYLQRLVFILKLGLFILAGDDDSRRNMGQTHCGVSGIDTLTAVSGCTEHVKFTVIHINLNIHFLGLRHNRYRRGGGVDSTAGLCLRHTLNTVNTALIFEFRERSLTGNHEYSFLKAADSALIDADQFRFPTVALRKTGIHAVELRGKQRSLVSASSGANLHKYILVIVGILRQQEYLNFLLQLQDTLSGIGELFLRQLAHLLIALLLQQHQTVLDILLCAAILAVCLHNGSQICMFLHQFAKLCLILHHIRVVHLRFQLLISDPNTI